MIESAQLQPSKAARSRHDASTMGPTTEAELKPRRHTGGRPSQEDALRRDERLVEIAARMFLERGFDATTIDAVAEAASVGKATLYARYKDKAALFAAVVQRQIDRWLVPLGEAAQSPLSGRVDEALLSISRTMMTAALAPEALAINRILIAQALRFPELARLAHQEGWQRSTAALAAVLVHFEREGQIVLDNADLAADLFLSLVIGRQTRLAMLGIDTDPAQVDHRIRAAVRLFLEGVRAR